MAWANSDNGKESIRKACNEFMQRQHKNRVEAGLCRSCGVHNIAEHSVSQCEDCLLNQRMKEHLLNSGDLQSMFEEQMYSCFYTGEPIRKSNFTVEHIVPRVWCREMGYSASVYNIRENLALVTRFANFSKNRKPLDEWYIFRGLDPKPARLLVESIKQKMREQHIKETSNGG